jgi:Lipocalin-like domain
MTACSSLLEIFSGRVQKRRRAAQTYITYCGRYEFHGDTVVQHVELSLFPNWVGVDQERLIEVTGNRLTVSTRPMLLDGIQQSGHLIWERV